MVDQEFLEWKKHPVTEKLYRLLEDRKKEIMEAWAAGSYTYLNSDGTSQKNAEALGMIRAVMDILTLEAGDLDE